MSRRRRRRDEVRWWLIFNICDFGWSWTWTWAALRGINVTSVFMCSRVESLKTGGSLQCSLVVLIQGSPILGYSDGVHPKQHRVFVVTAQELDVVRLFLDAGMLQHEAEVGGSSVFLLVVVGGVDVDFFKMDKAGEIAGSLCLSLGYIVDARGPEHKVARFPNLLPIFLEVQHALEIRNNHSRTFKMLLE